MSAFKTQTPGNLPKRKHTCEIIIATACDSDSSIASNKQHGNKPVSAPGVLIDGTLLIVNTIMAHMYLFILEDRWTSYPIIFLYEVCAKRLLK